MKMITSLIQEECVLQVQLIIQCKRAIDLTTTNSRDSQSNITIMIFA